MYRITSPPRYNPDDRQRSYVASHGRCIPCVVLIERQTSTIVWYQNVRNLELGKYELYTKVRDVDILDAIAASSAYFGILADPMLRKYLMRRSLMYPARAIVETIFWSRITFDSLAVRLPVHELSFQFADGGVWDNYGLPSALLALKRRGVLFGATIIVVTCDVFCMNEWWEGERKRHAYYPSPSLFQGRIRDNLASHHAWKGDAFVNVFKKCTISPSNPFREWYDDGTDITLVVLGVVQSNLATIPMSAYDNAQYKKYDAKIRTYLSLIYETMDVKGPYAICLAGGGCRAALIGMRTLSYLTAKLTPSVLACVSGGAWGAALFYLYRTMNPDHLVDVLLRNCQILRNRLDVVTMQGLRAFDNADAFATLTIAVPSLARPDLQWSEMVSIILFGESKPHRLHKIFPPNLSVSIPISLLCGASVEKN